MARIITYGAYNLCFDPTLGQMGGAGPDFFKFMVDNQFPVNRVRVFLFRRSTQEGLQPGQSIPLFVNRALNPRFLTNLQRLVRRARASRIMVQMCLFSYHSVLREQPESPPHILDTAAWPGDGCAKLRRFFSLNDPQVVDAQAALVQSIVTSLRDTVGLQGVIFEIANEVRIDLCRTPEGGWDAEQDRLGNCEVVPWLNRMAQVIRDAAAPQGVRRTTSTGTHSERTLPGRPGEANEAIIFNKNRDQVRCGDASAFVPNFFDLHAGQWEPVGIDPAVNEAEYLRQLPLSIAAVRTRLQGYGYPNPMVVLNDDGLNDERRRTPYFEHYVREAFRAGFGYASKQEYPPVPFDLVALRTLKRLNAQIPAAAPTAAEAEAEALEFAGPVEA
jgi:hypothetical protein